MTPVFSKHYKIDGTKMYFEDFGETSLGFSVSVTAPYFENLNLFKNRVWTFLTRHRQFGLPSFFQHVLNIIFWRASKQMVWVTARRIIAVMANIQRLIKCPECKKVSIPMRGPIPTIVIHPPILIPNTSCKWPAFIWITFFNTAPESMWCFSLKPFFVFLETCSTKCLKFGRVLLHNSDNLICATFPASPEARGHSFYSGLCYTMQEMIRTQPL